MRYGPEWSNGDATGQLGQLADELTGTAPKHWGFLVRDRTGQSIGLPFRYSAVRSGDGRCKESNQAAGSNAHAPEFAPKRFMSEMNNVHELNLQAHRASTSVWERRGWDGSREEIAITRLLLGIGGAALAFQGIRLGTWKGRALAGLGGSVAWFALTGEGDLSHAREWFRRVVGWAGEGNADLVSDASAESFPASDAPSWTPTVGTGLRRSPANH